MTNVTPIRRRAGLLSTVAALFTAWRLHRADRRAPNPYYDPKLFRRRR
ncbi:hypothetical protein HUS70_07540 [Pandoraea nosoerga]|nr:hypothetical protein [Pandoraea nosoerga]MBN4665412.1 hypothetical protein [Pandoraea nosoerga]MBN4674937.1 hypothetical protein [Pandoraea nosoerga]MBN4680253.1 hypothetical protein [Pandoraea nosoerga]MBN4744514.1 hypothetical protein [Pandoraea nosoerga]